MKIVVCIKQVPDTEARLKINPDGRSLDTTGIKWIINPYDEYAIEESLKIKESLGANNNCQILALSMGPKKRVIESLRVALAMGVDQAVVIDAPENPEALVTAKALAAYIKESGGADLILSGKLALDDNGFSVTQMIAEFLKIPHITAVSKLSFSENSLSAERDVDGGVKELIEVQLPAIIAANKGLNNPRFASLPGIMKAKKKEIKEIELQSLVKVEEKVHLLKLDFPPDKNPARIISGNSTAEKVLQLIHLLRDEAKVL